MFNVIVSILFLVSFAPQTLTGLWAIPQAPEIQVAFGEHGNGKLEAVTIINPGCNKKIYTKFIGKVERSKNHSYVTFWLESDKKKISDTCFVQVRFLGQGTIISSKPRNFVTKVAVISLVTCEDKKKNRIDIDDFSGTWKNIELK